MNPKHLLSISLILYTVAIQAQPTAEESSAIAFFKESGNRVTLDSEGHATKLFCGGKPPLSIDDFQRVGQLPHLEAFAVNSPPMGNDEWGFLKKLPKLANLTIWHGKHFSNLEAFNYLPIESLTIGGCMGLRDLNKETPEKHRDAVLSLRNLPNLKKANLYHSPTICTDAHLAHLVVQFPNLNDLKIDFSAPRGFETTITPQGLADLKKLPLVDLSIEHANPLTPEHMAVLGGIEMLQAVLIDARRNAFDTAPLVAALKSNRPDLEVVVAGPDAEGPPQKSRKAK